MGKWFDRARTIGDTAVQVHAVATVIGYILAVFAAMVVAMSYVTGSIASLSQYGWGLPVLVAIGVSLIIIIALSLAAVPAAKAWRHYRPYRMSENGEHKAETRNKEISVLAAISPHDEIERVASALQIYVDSRCDSLEKKLKEAQDALAAFAERESTHELIVANRTHLLIRGIRAREARRFILTPNDEIARSLGKRLAEAVSYHDTTSWLADYQKWNAAVRAIDNLMIEWTKGQSNEHASLFDLKGYHYGQAPMPPDNIRSDDIIIYYKTLWQVQSSYRNQREGFFSFFNEREVLPG